MAAANSTQQLACAVNEVNPNTQWPSLEDYTREHSVSDNDYDWLHQFVSSDAISTGKVGPKYLIRVLYKDTEATSTTITKDFGTGSLALLNLQKTLALKYIRAVILCHRDSSQVDPDVIDLLWTKYKLEVSFLRQHFDYKGFRDEPGCPRVISHRLKEEDHRTEDYWTFGGRWNPVRLPSETHASILRLSVDPECVSVCCRSGVGESGFYQMLSDV